MKTIKINKAFKLIFFFMILSILVSCNNEDIDLKDKKNEALNIRDYYEVLMTDTPGGQILLQSYASTTTQDYHRATSIESNFNKKNKFKESFILVDKETGEVFNTNKSSEIPADKLFGRSFSYSIGEEQQKGGVNENGVYIPDLITAQFSSNVIEAGTTISWNVDSLNENGLVLWYEYNPFLQTSYTIVDQNRNMISGAVTIPDEGGSYTLTADDISNLPSGSRIRFHVSRGGFDVSQNSEGEQIGFIGVTSVTKEAKVEL